MSHYAMLPTISVGSIVKITKKFDSLDYGDLVVINYDGLIDGIYNLKGPLIYRIVGLPGDSISVEKDFCIINGKKNEYRLIQENVQNHDVDDMYKNSITEYEEIFPNRISTRIYRIELNDKDIERMIAYLKEKDKSKIVFSYNDIETIKIPDNHYFMMGDFRSQSLDSRDIGVIHREQIMGKVIKIKQKRK